MKLGAIILAAGLSRRFGSENKLLHPVAGEPLLGRVLSAFEGAKLNELLVVTGHDSDPVEELLGERGIGFVFNASYKKGMGTSIACGVRALRNASLDGLFVCLGDLPGLKTEHVLAVRKAFLERNGNSVALPRFRGERGHPVCFPKRCFSQLESLEGDLGAKEIIAGEGERLVFVDAQEDACVRDLDSL